MKQEQKLQQSVCTYIKYQYPHIIFFSDASGVRVSIGQAKQMKALRSGKSIPDLFIAEPSNGFHGLFIEFKSKSPFTQKGSLFADTHLMEQSEMLGKLIEKGYNAFLCWDFNDAKKLVDEYLTK